MRIDIDPLYTGALLALVGGAYLYVQAGGLLQATVQHSWQMLWRGPRVMVAVMGLGLVLGALIAWQSLGRVAQQYEAHLRTHHQMRTRPVYFAPSGGTSCGHAVRGTGCVEQGS